MPNKTNIIPAVNIEKKIKLKFMGKLFLASYEIQYSQDGTINWIFTTNKNRIVATSTNLPITPRLGELPVEIRRASDNAHTQTYKIIYWKIESEMFSGIKGAIPPESVRAIRQTSLLDKGTQAAVCDLVKLLPRDYIGGLLPKRGEKKIREFIMGFKYEAVFPDGRAVLVTVCETAITQKQTEQKQEAFIKPVKTTKPQSQNILHKTGRGWEIRFKGGKQTWDINRKGYKYIRELLSRPKHDYTASDLTMMFDTNPDKQRLIAPGASQQAGLHEAQGIKQGKLDAQAIKEILQKKGRLQTEIDDPQTNEASRKEAQEELDNLEAELKSATFRGKTKTFKTQADTDSKRISKAIKEAREAIAKELPDLAKYFKHTIHTGKTYSYTGEIKFR